MNEEFAIIKKNGGKFGFDDQKRIQEKIEVAERKRHGELQKDLNKLKEKLAQETELIRTATNIDEVWKDCTATKEVYKLCVDWLEKDAVTAACKDVEGMAIDFEPGSPMAVPQEEGLFLIPERFRSKAAKGALTLNLGIDTSMPPSKTNLEDIGDALRWICGTQDKLQTKRQKFELEVLLPQVISKNHLPEQWLVEARKDPSKLPALRHMIDLSLKIRNYATAIKTLKLDTAGVAVMPPFAKPNGEEGKLYSLNLELPKTLDMQNANTLAKVEAWTKWLDKNGPALDKAIEEKARAFDLSQQVFFGEVETKGIIYTPLQGKQEILDPKDPKTAEKVASGRTQEFNLLSFGFKVTHQNGKIVIEREVQPKSAQLYNYLNIGAANAGQPFTETKVYEPSDPVAVRNSMGEVKIVRADELESWLIWQQCQFYGSKTVTATMDIGLLVTSGGTLSAAAKAGQLTLRMALPAVARLGLAAGGLVLNNAAAHSDEFLSKVDTARGLLMFFDVAQGTGRAVAGGGRSFLRWMTGTKKTAESLSTAQKITNGLKSSQASWKWMALWKGSEALHYPMGVANIPFGVMLVIDIKEQLKIAGDGRESPFTGKLAGKIIGDGRQLVEMSTPDEVRAFMKRAATGKLIDSYTDLLSKKADQSKTSQLKEIADTTKKLLDPSAKKTDREEFKNRMLDIWFGKETSRTASDTTTARGTDKKEATVRASRQDPETKLAAAAALLFLFAEQGQMPPETVIAERTVEVTGTDDTKKSIKQTITAADLVKFLKLDSSDKSNPFRSMVTGDLLVRTGSRSPLSYAATLKEVVANQTASAEERTSAIVQLGSMINSIQLMETAMETMSPAERSSLQTALSGNTSKELMEVLRTVANSGKDKDLRAFAGAILHTLGKEFKPDEVNRLIQADYREFAARKDTPGGYADFFVNQIKNEFTTSTDLALKLNALL
ncbi:MAG: hypothetical protein K2Z81_04840, partial [Cyanobacteria bacterium]|nr:hypothetical protein [Cyanobacteriota bacterium]